MTRVLDCGSMFKMRHLLLSASYQLRIKSAHDYTPRTPIFLKTIHGGHEPDSADFCERT